MGIAVALPLIAAAAWAALFWRRSGDGLDALLKAALVFILIAFALSEGLGAFGLLTRAPLAAGWCLAAAWPLILFLGAPNRPLPVFRRPSPLPAACLALAGLIALITLCLALGQPQWNIDAQLYHLPRVEQWVQNRSLALYPTPYDLQDFFPPGAELLSLQFRLLAGSAALAGAVQWLAYALAGAAAAGSVRALGGGEKPQALAVLAWAATPMAVAQSSTAQSDVIAAAGAALTAYFCLRHDREPEGIRDLWAAAALGAALMLKGTDYLFVPCFGLWAALRRDWRRPQAARLGLLLALAAAPSLPYWLRNFDLCGSPLGSSTMHLLKGPGPASILSNGLKSLGDELRVPSRTVNAWTTEAVSRAHALLHLPLNNPDWIFTMKSPYGDPHYAAFCAWWHEDYSGAPLQTLALAIVFAAALVRPLGRRRLYWAACLGSALLYLTFVRWNLWDTRLELPLYALAAAPLGLGLGSFRRPAVVWGAVALFGAQGLWAACGDQGRPPALLFSRARTQATLLAAVPGIAPGLEAALRGASIGLLEPPRCCPEDGICEYGVWLGAHGSGRPTRIQHLIASPATAPLQSQAPWRGFKPDVIVADAHAFGDRELRWGGRVWRRLGDDGTWAVYLPAPYAKPNRSGQKTGRGTTPGRENPGGDPV